MPIVPHPACVEPPVDAVICRFMDFPKFRDLFASEEIYLRRVDLFKETDPREALPDDDYVRKVLGLKRLVLADELELQNQQAFTRQHSEGHFINCWQLFEGETAEMWTTYGKGVAVFSTFRAPASQLSRCGWIRSMWGSSDTENKGMAGYNLINFLFTKQSHFLQEKGTSCSPPVSRPDGRRQSALRYPTTSRTPSRRKKQDP